MERCTQLRVSYEEVRAFSTRLVDPLETEDCVIQTMPDVSPTRWHLAHTTWFFETFVLKPHRVGYRSIDPAFAYLFNSYYHSVGDQFPRPQRGFLSRPTVAEVMAYRRSVDEAMRLLFDSLPNAAATTDAILDTVELGIHHEQQHQELILTDIKHVFSCNPLSPEYQPHQPQVDAAGFAERHRWLPGIAGIVEIGDGTRRFVFDNERPRHQTLLHPYVLANRLVTAGEYLEFMEQGGYQRPELWLSLGWDTAQREGWQAPLYWRSSDHGWHQFTLQGLRTVELEEPVCHVSYFEADAYARWRGARLPLESEWEVMAAEQPIAGNLAEGLHFHPRPLIAGGNGCRQLYGDVWEWTAEPLRALPRLLPAQRCTR